MTALHRLATEAGLLVDWEDAAGRQQRVSDDSLVAILAALGLAADSEARIEESRQRLREDDVRAGRRLVTTEIGQSVVLPGRDAPIAFDEIGYHAVETEEGAVTVAVAPARAWSVAEAAPGRRVWGAAVQVPSLRDRREAAFGDFGALARFVRAAGAKGADAVAMSPVHALFPADPSRYSPYGPSSRLFLNVLMADPSLMGSEERGGEVGELIDWAGAIPARLDRLRALFDRRDAATRSAIAAFAAEGGEALARHALYDALHARFSEKGAGGFHDWPGAYRDPESAQVAAFAATHRQEVEFHIFLQWLADRSLEAAQAAAKEAGMAIGLVADLAVGMDAGGSQAWSQPGRLLDGLSVGAPPDLLGPDGQDWGITTFSPRSLRRHGFESFIDTIRASVRHAGGIRIDHAMGLRRLWVIPHGARPTEGAYLTYPETDLMRLLALESWRARAIVIGEDLGTVPEGFRGEMERRALLGMRVLWFERTKSGGFRRHDGWSRCAAAMTSTHDLPTVAGWWSGRDIDWTWKIGRTSAFASEGAERAAREEDRVRLWTACQDQGTATGSAPAPHDPGPAVDAAIAYVGSTPSDIALVPLEDLLAFPEQPNLPGTIDEHPNWRRRLPIHVEVMLDDFEVSARIARLNTARS